MLSFTFRIYMIYDNPRKLTFLDNLCKRVTNHCTLFHLHFSVEKGTGADKYTIARIIRSVKSEAKPVITRSASMCLKDSLFLTDFEKRASNSGKFVRSSFNKGGLVSDQKCVSFFILLSRSGEVLE